VTYFFLVLNTLFQQPGIAVVEQSATSPESVLEMQRQLDQAGQYFHNGKADQAIEILTAITMMPSSAADISKIQAIAWHRLGYLHAIDKQWEKAESELITARKKKTAVFGPNHTELVATLKTLARVYAHLDKEDQAMETARTAVTIASSGFGDASSKAALALYALGQVQAHFKHYDDAEDTLQKALVSLYETQGKDHSDNIDPLKALAGVNMAKIKPTIASALLLKAWRLEKEINPRSSYQTRIQLAAAYLASDDSLKAHKHFTELLSQLEQQQPPISLLVATCHLGIGTCYAQWNNQTEAIEEFEKGLARIVNQSDESQTLYLELLKNIATSKAKLDSKP